jgi:hypothetical protein
VEGRECLRKSVQREERALKVVAPLHNKAWHEVLDRPQTGRTFFEQVNRENLNIGRPDQVQLISNAE